MTNKSATGLPTGQTLDIRHRQAAPDTSSRSDSRSTDRIVIARDLSRGFSIKLKAARESIRRENLRANSSKTEADSASH